MPNSDFLPLWASPPGDTIKAIVRAKGIPETELPSILGLSSDATVAVLDGSAEMSLKLARRIAENLGSSAEFWMTRDGQYRDDLTRLDGLAWLESLPVTEMQSLDWLHLSGGQHEKLLTCYAYFDVQDVAEWTRTYGTLLNDARFRAPESVSLSLPSVAAWVRQGEIEAAQLNCEPWNADRFRAALLQCKSLTRERDPREFLQALQAICAKAGVAVVAVRPPKGARVSGAARWLDNHGLIVLTGRHLSDDHLWFTFFHEAGHLLLHDQESTFLDDFDRTVQRGTFDEETEADSFAQGTLIPNGFPDELAHGRPTPKTIARVARSNGISAGLMVGQLQHAGLIGYNRFNNLKRRYRWSGSTLEMA